MSAKAAIRVLIGLIVIVLIIIVLSYTGVFGKLKNRVSLGSSNKWQAIFLTNGQVYFGKVTNIDDKSLVLTKIYYLQVEQQLQPEKQDTTNQQPKLSLVKLGNELHGPEDQMRINRNQVLFTEDLKDSGKVVTAITDYEKNGSQPTANTSATPEPAAP